MFDIQRLFHQPRSGFDIYRTERLLFNELTIYNSANDEKTPLSLNSSVLEVEEHFNMRSFFENETAERKRLSPVWRTALNYWIYEIEYYMLGINIEADDFVNIDYNNYLIHDVYSNVTAGINKYLYQYSKDLISEFKVGDVEKVVLIETFLKDIARGVSIAFILPKLKEELNSLSEGALPNTEIEKIDLHKKDKLSTKQQILLLHKLGIFDLPALQQLTIQKMGILFANILNRHEKNTEDTIRNRFVNLSPNIQRPVDDLLKQLDLDKIIKL